MLKIVVLSITIACVFASPLPNAGRVVNGTNAKPGEIPYIVSLRFFNSHSCGASVLDKRHVLTAAHCVLGDIPSSLSIQYGETHISKDSNQVIQVTKILAHKEFDPWGTKGNDIAVLELASDLPLSEFVQPIVLPEQDEEPPAGETSILAGWGLPSTGGGIMTNLQRVDLVVYSFEDCQKAHGSKVYPKYHLCSGVPGGGKGQCSGDSGGPLVADGKQIGAVSWSVKPCAVDGYPGVYTRISSYANWIKQQIQVS